MDSLVDGCSVEPMKIVGSRRKLRCQQCDKYFTKAEHLTRHERSHAGIKSFQCKLCPKAFGRLDSLNRHTKLHKRASSQISSDRSTPPSIQNRQSKDYQLEELNQPSSMLMEVAEGSAYSGEGQMAGNLDMSLQHWTESEDLLQILMSGSLPSLDSLPLAQFTPTAFSDSYIIPDPTDDSNQPRNYDGPTNQGQQAVAQMGRLISDLSSSLTAEINSTGITSGYLETCLHMFFERFVPAFPVLHKYTFVSRECSPTVLLNITALGSLFVSSKDALRKGETLWRIAHTAVATMWQALITHRGPRDTCNGVQLLLTALLGQTYALLSKNPSLRLTSLNFHSLGFFWARQCGMYLESDIRFSVPSMAASAEKKVEAWRIWAAKQVQLRAVLGHYILDGQISRFSGSPTSVRHTANPLPVPDPEAAFEAESVDQWIAEMEKLSESRSFREVFLVLFSNNSVRVLENLSSFSIRIILEGLQSAASDISDAIGPIAGMHTKAEICDAMLRLYEYCLAPSIPHTVEVDHLELLIRWHLLGLDLATCSVSLCQKICSHYGMNQSLFRNPLRPSTSLDLSSWASSKDGRRALFHATAIQDIAEKLPLGRSNAIHVPMALFATATIYAGLCFGGHCSVRLPRKTTWSDIWDDSILFEGIEPKTPASNSPTGIFELNGQLLSTRNVLYELTSLKSLMSGSSRWGISSAMDEILQQWIFSIQTSTGREM